jgi:hypothetical protein
LLQAIQPKEEIMRHVYSNHEIPHLWAHQSQDEARNSTGSLYFEGPTIYSYGSHFPIARHVTNVRDEKAVLFTIDHHSVTTSGHCSVVAGAIPPNVPVFRVPHLRNSWGDLPDHADNVESYVRRISELLGKAKRARVNRDWLEREALALREQLRGYLAFFDVVAVALPESDELDTLEAWIREHEEEERQRREETARIAEEVRRREQAEQIQRFLAGDPHASYIPGVSPMLRVVGDEVETSLGARFPIEHAIRGLAFVRGIRASGREYVRNGHAIHLGNYVVDRIEPDGTVHAGCHVVRWEEMERIALELSAPIDHL